MLSRTLRAGAIAARPLSASKDAPLRGGPPDPLSDTLARALPLPAGAPSLAAGDASVNTSGDDVRRKEPPPLLRDERIWATGD
jgi:hypothetical protein